MNKKYGIGFFTTAILAFAIISGAYQISYEKAKERAQEENMIEEQKQTITTEGEASKEDCYYLRGVNGYVAVYLGDQKTVYEYTDILIEDLPVPLQNEIEKGKYIEDTETLYGFLENYYS